MLQGNRKKSTYCLMFTAIWVATLFVLAIQPESTVERFFHQDFMSSMAHVAGYFVLAFLLAAGFGLSRSTLKNALILIASIVAISIVTGIFTELIQKFAIDRTCSYDDFKFDMYGMIGGLMFYSIASLAGSFFRKNGILPRRILGYRSFTPLSRLK